MHALPSHTLRVPATAPPSGVSMEPSPPWRPATPALEAPLPAATHRPAARWVWHSRFGAIVIEVRGDEVFVNGERVEPHAP